MFELIEAIDIIIGLLLGFWASKLFHKPIPKSDTLPPTKEIVSMFEPVPTVGPGPDKVYVRFNYLDGHVEVKKFKSTDLDLEMSWRGRKFIADEWTQDGHVYKEVVNNG